MPAERVSAEMKAFVTYERHGEGKDPEMVKMCVPNRDPR
jgi:hypothetical protein